LSQHIQIFSAGMDAKTGTPSPKAAVNVAAFYGINLSHHTSNKISPEQLHTTDVVFCMEYWHLESLEKLYPAMTGRLYLISQFDPDWDKLPTYLKYNIPDPYGKNEEQFHTIFNRIIHCLDNLFIELEKRKSK
jgi:protein-tyrosine-phosphatase